MVKLVVISDELSGKEFELTDEKISVGRLPDNKIHIDHSAVSSRHAELTQKGSDYVVRDLNSTNGTRVNGQRVVETKLSHGDTVGFAHIQCQYISTSRDKPQPLPEPNRRMVDLSMSSIANSKHSASFISSSPFSNKQNKKKYVKFFQILTLIFGFIAIIVVFIAIVALFTHA